jgi:ribonucleoside-diphosphate reductase alpha chain
MKRGRPASEECPECGSKMMAHLGGCLTCLNCGWSACVSA